MRLKALDLLDEDGALMLFKRALPGGVRNRNLVTVIASLSSRACFVAPLTC